VIREYIEFISFKIISPFKWTRIKYLITGREYDLQPRDRDMIRDLCEQGTYLWLTRRDTHLTTYLITFSDYILALISYYREGRKGKKPRLGYYSHAFLNSDKDTFIEAVARGVVSSYFDNVFNADAAAGLMPSKLTRTEWAMFSKKFVEVAKSKIGTPYDTFFNLKDESEVSCIELIRVSLHHCMSEEDYNLRFKNFEALIAERRNLTPDMLRDCEDFEVILEIRR
jgi:hypothetical protein